MAKPIKIVIVGDASGLNRTLSGVEKRLSGFGATTHALGQKVTAAGETMVSAGKSYSKGVTLPLIALGTLAAKQAVDFEASMNLLVTAAGESRSKLAAVSAGVLQIAKDTGTPVAQLSKGLYEIEKAGKHGSDGLTVLKAAAEGARAEGVDLDTMASAVTSVMQSYVAYYPKASDAVKVTNQMVVAAGESKTTMELFANSLSTVLPVASAAHVSFAQVGGAIATLTQHGTSAHQATQDLAATIRSLSAPNRVAQNEMQQLGLSVNDVTQNLGKRGLTGTLDLVVGAITKHMGPAGTVLYNAFNQSKSAAADAKAMLASMPEPARKLSQAYMDGSVSLGDWIVATKKMDPASANLARQFKTTEDKARGFNSLLRAGDPASRTFAASLKALMGGTTGMNTALMLTADNMPFFEDAVKKIGAATNKSGKDISSWAQTQATTKVQLAKLKEQVEVTGITLGQALIPAVQDSIVAAKPLIDGVAHLAQQFHDADPATQRLIIKIAALAATLGPAVIVLGKITSATGTMLTAIGKTANVTYKAGSAVLTFGSQLLTGFRAPLAAANELESGVVRAGGKIRNAVDSIGPAVQSTAYTVIDRFKAAGAAVSALPGNFKAASGAASKLKAIGTAAAGVGTALGPVALAVAGVGLAIGVATYAWQKHAQAQQEAKQRTQDLTQALIADNYAIGENTRAFAAQDLGKVISGWKSAAAMAQDLGISQHDLTSAYLGQADAIARVNAVLDKYKNSDAAVKNGGTATMITESQDLRKALDNGSGAYKNAQQAAELYREGTGAAATATDTQVSALDRLNQRLDLLSGKSMTTVQDQLALRSSEQGFTESVNAAAKAGEAGARTLDANTRAGLANRQAMVNMVQQAQELAKATLDQTGSTKKSSDAYNAAMNSIYATGRAAGLSKGDIDKLVASLHATPKEVSTAIHMVGAQDAINLISEVTRQVRDAEGVHTVTIRTVHTSDGVTQSYGNKSAQAKTSARGNIFEAFAGGGVREDHKPMIASVKPSSVRVWAEPETKGEAYIPLANDSRRPRAKAILQTVAAKFGGYAQFANGGITRSGKNWVWDNLLFASYAAAHNAALRSSRSKQSAAQRGQVAAEKSRASIRFKIDTSDLAKLGSAAKMTADSLSNLLHTTYVDARKAVTAGAAGSGIVATVQKDAAKLRNLAADRDVTATRLAAANKKLADAEQVRHDYAASVAGTVTGAFNIASPATDVNTGTVTGRGILADLQSQVAAASTFRSGMKALTGKHLNSDLLKSLADDGTASNESIQALLGANPATLKAINDNWAKLKGTALGAGTDIAHTLYDAGVNSAAGIVKGLQSHLGEITKAMNTVANAMVKAIKKALGIHSPSRVFRDEVGAQIVRGTAHGITGNLPIVRDAATGMATAAVRAAHPRFGPGGGGGGSSVTFGDINVNVASTNASPREIGNELAFALKTSGR